MLAILTSDAVSYVHTYVGMPVFQKVVLIVMLNLEQVHLEETPGDILLFLTGQEEIESMERLLKERASHLSQNVQKLLVVPIYAALPSEQQMRVFQAAPEGTRKVYLIMMQRVFLDA